MQGHRNFLRPILLPLVGQKVRWVSCESHHGGTVGVLGYEIELIGSAILIRGQQHRILCWVVAERARPSVCACNHQAGSLFHELFVVHQKVSPSSWLCIYRMQILQLQVRQLHQPPGEKRLSAEAAEASKRGGGFCESTCAADAADGHEGAVALAGEVIGAQVALFDIVQRLTMCPVRRPFPLQLEDNHPTAPHKRVTMEECHNHNLT